MSEHENTTSEDAEQPATTVDVIQWQDDRLEELDPDDYHVCDWWAKTEYFIGDDGFVDGEIDERSVSLVIRDEDDEILAEGTPYNTTGLYALVRVKDVPDDIPDRGELPEPPAHIEWVHCEGPLAHKARAVRCVDCAEEFEFHRPKMPKGAARREPWTELPHRPSCEHADEWCKQYWAELQMAQLISERGTRTHTIGALWREADSLQVIRDSDDWGHLHDPVHERWSQIYHELVDRLQPRYPSCPECGEMDWNLIEGRWPEECRACGAVASRRVGEAYDTQRQRVWGWRGHGDRSRGDDS